MYGDEVRETADDPTPKFSYGRQMPKADAS